MKVQYQGPISAVEIAATGQIVARGDTVDVPAEVANSLLDQEDTWVKPKTTKTKSKSEDEGDD